MFNGLSAFPLTPVVKGEIEEKSFVSLIESLVNAGVNTIGALGSTGSYAYLTREQRYRATKLAVGCAGNIPVMTSIGSVSTEEVLRLAQDAQHAGVSGVLLAPVSYQKLTPEEVFRLYERVSAELSVPFCLYENSATTGFEFTDELLISISALKNMGSIKLAFQPADLHKAAERITDLKHRLPASVTLGISGDAQSAAGLLAGCDVWYSVVAGLFPHYALRLTQAALGGNREETDRLNSALDPLWAFYRRHGSLRVIATVAEIIGRVPVPCLPFPLQTLTGTERTSLERILTMLPLLSDGGE